MVDPGNHERGLKAAMHNPRVSEQAKQRDREKLENEYVEGAKTEEMGSSSSSNRTSKSKNPSSSMPESSSGLHKSQMKGARTAAPQSSRAIMLPQDMERKNTGNVFQGLEAAISNKNTPEEAKERDRQKLRGLGE